MPFQGIAIGFFLFWGFGSALSAQTFSGTYSGLMNGVNTTLVFRQTGTALVGQLTDPDGYFYNLRGDATGRAAKGKLTDPQQGGVMDFEATLTGTGLTLTLAVVNPQTGQVTRIPVDYRRGGTVKNKPSAAPPAGSLDATLVGVWERSESRVSGSFTMATLHVLTLGRDGTFRHKSQSAGGGDLGAFESGGDVSTGRWKTTNKVLYMMASNGGQWQAVGRYVCDGSRVMITYSDGSKAVWSRQF